MSKKLGPRKPPKRETRSRRVPWRVPDIHLSQGEYDEIFAIVKWGDDMPEVICLAISDRAHEAIWEATLDVFPEKRLPRGYYLTSLQIENDEGAQASGGRTKPGHLVAILDSETDGGPEEVHVPIVADPALHTPGKRG